MLGRPGNQRALSCHISTRPREQVCPVGSAILILPGSRYFTRMHELGLVKCVDLEASRPRRHCPIGKDFR